MRRAVVILGILAISLGILSGCLSGAVPGRSWEEFFPASVKTLPNREAVDRALRLDSLPEGDRPFHLKLVVSAPHEAPADSAQIEIFWLNPNTYRTVIHSRAFSQTRIVNAAVVEEHNTGEFYPRWIQNFVDAVLQPIPNAARLRKTPGEIPIDPQSQPCIADSDTPSPNEGGVSRDGFQACFAGSEPKLTSGRSRTRYVAFDDFEPFGSQQIARTLVNDLPDGTLIRARITQLEPLAHRDYGLLRAVEYTLPAQQMLTTVVEPSTAEALLEAAPGRPLAAPALQRVSAPLESHGQAAGAVAVYVRTDRAGKVREAYLDNSSHPELHGLNADAVVDRAMRLKFKPLLVNGAPRQAEATLTLR